jgi:4-alpha-glucanotransferase
MGKISILLALHNHQPVGNFDWVIDDAFERCYKPLLETFAAVPNVKFALHFSGPLYDFMDRRRHAEKDLLGEMVSRGQVELLGGGYYEPILTSIPEDDAAGQLQMMSDYLHREFGTRPRGIWLTERIWDPVLPRLLSACGVEYTIVDTSHFQYAGANAADLFGHYITEKHGRSLMVFPSDRHLRYMIPFRLVEDNERYLADVAEMAEQEIALTYGDDGEKFGLWPGTFQWVYNERWLAKFLEMFERNGDWLQADTFSAYVDRAQPRDRIYFPSASYAEMLEWAMPAEAIVRFESFKQAIEEAGLAEAGDTFVRGGYWDNFLTKYPESNRMHKRMIFVSEKLAKRGKELPAEDLKKATDHLYQAQCNCAYWHGLFGGLYLGHLRHAIFEQLLRAEQIANPALGIESAFTEIDFECNGRQDLVVETTGLFGLVRPAEGGSIAMIEDRSSAFSLTNLIGRRFEGYHPKILQALREGEQHESDEPQSIHDRVVIKSDNLEAALIYDRHPRYCFADNLIPGGIDWQELAQQRFPEVEGFLSAAFKSVAEITERGVQIMMSRTAEVRFFDFACEIEIEKSFLFLRDQPAIEADYLVSFIKGDKIDLDFTTEFNLTLLAGRDASRYFRCDGAHIEDPALESAGVLENVTMIGMFNDWDKFAVKIEPDAPSRLIRYPVETVSQSESGFEKTYQGSCLVFTRPISLGKEPETRFGFKLYVEHF